MISRYSLLFVFLPFGAPLVLNNNVGKLPVLGWNSWNAYHCDINEEQILNTGRQFIDLGLTDVGYKYINIDDCWSVKDHRDPVTNRIIPDPTRFPNGISHTARYLHELGFKLGIYSSAGTTTCAGYPASLGFESVDAAAWAEWGVDYLKYDNCNFPQELTDECKACVPENRDDLVNGTCTNTNGLCPPDYDYTQSHTHARYTTMRDALLAQPRTILYSLCEWGEAGVNQWGNDTASSWRMSFDIDPSWSRILSILNQNSFYLHHVDFWGHPDADMLEVGNGISLAESKTHFALWAAMKSPLLIGTDLAKISRPELDVLKNKYLLSFNQDPVVGRPAMPYKWGTNPDWTFNASFPAEFWSGPSSVSNGTLVLMFNPYADGKTKSAVWDEIPELKGGESYHAVDIWSGLDLGCVEHGVDLLVEGHGTAGLWIDHC
ncbi:glycoside hydrolase family 27 protein [Melanomma pulvis-pyrius CBS 109.77]|uniref:Alpha-galactosidase n=1 Tax=Melanomma pulvis-pyrius CBS 109.77 TaxID=1314802 RepID=A0A6A6X863_9PLEO|nr:glycoside hydrolase family 27 protein [Melanomma pulvis-pyrius CBS 109.77]